MGSMTDERRKEMEDEMMRFEQEIAIPGDDEEEGEPKKLRPAQRPAGGLVRKKLSPPPLPPNMASMFQKALKPPPLPPRVIQNIPPESLPPPHIHRPPLPPPPPPIAHMQFIPHQIQRQPPRILRPNIVQMRAPPGYHGPGPMPFPPMQGGLHHMSLPLPPMGMPLPMPPGFCPPPPGIPLAPMPPQSFIPHVQIPFNEPSMIPPKQEPPPVKITTSDVTPVSTTSATAATTSIGSTTTTTTSSNSNSTSTAAPVMYSALPKKRFIERSTDNQVINGSSTTTIVTSTPVAVSEEIRPGKPEEAINSSNPSTVTAGDTTANKKEKKKKKIVRMAGGQAWEDNSLMDWESDDFRIFCGDLGNDVTDEVLIRAFSKYQSFGKAKVIRDKRTNKTKGYGFVSFNDPQDFIKAMREMNGRYVGSRPIKLRKSTWRDRNIDIVRKKQKEKERLGLL